MCTARSPDKKTSNEDAAVLIPVSNTSSVLVVADGAGGMRGGEQASALTVELILKSVQQAISVGSELRDAILNGIEQANSAIIALGIGAGSTVSVVEQNGSTIRTYHVGDSEIIIMGQRGRLIHQTIPHSPVGYAIEAGLIDSDEAMQHDQRHIVSNLLGNSEMHIAVGPAIELARYDTVLIASDGLTDNLPVDTIINTARKGRLSTAIRKLFKQTIEHMQAPADLYACKPDDLTIIGFRLYPLK